jgi:AcrR family transcriptional regulator
MPDKKRAPRLSTGERHEQILDTAVQLILTEGVARCTLETTAAAGGISKALIYRHFSSREELLTAIIVREYDIMRDLGLGELTGAFEEAFAHLLPKVFHYLLERGPIVRAMFNDRSVANLLREYDNARRESATKVYQGKVMEAFAVGERAAKLGVLLTANAPVASARALRSFGIDPDDAAEFWTTFLTGGWTAVSAVENLED